MRLPDVPLHTRLLTIRETARVSRLPRPVDNGASLSARRGTLVVMAIEQLCDRAGWGRRPYFCLRKSLPRWCRRLDVACGTMQPMTDRLKPGVVRDAILEILRGSDGLSVAEIHTGVSRKLGRDVAQSSVRSYLNLNTPGTFRRIKRGVFRLAQK